MPSITSLMRLSHSRPWSTHLNPPRIRPQTSGTASMLQSLLKWSKLAHPKPADQRHPFLLMETMIKGLAHSFPPSFLPGWPGASWCGTPLPPPWHSVPPTLGTVSDKHLSRAWWQQRQGLYLSLCWYCVENGTANTDCISWTSSWDTQSELADSEVMPVICDCSEAAGSTSSLD